MELEDFVPTTGKFKLSAIADCEFELNPISLDDEAWFMRTWTKEEFQSIFDEMKTEELCRIIFRLLPVEQKKIFKMQEVIEVGEDGVEKKVQIGGVTMLRRCIRGPGEKIDLLKALMATIGVSREAKELLDDAADKKKAVTKNPSPSTGEESLTS